MDDKSEMIDRIRELINKDSKSKSQILRELHLSTSTLSDWEKGKGNPSSSAIIKLAQYFNVSSDYILFGYQTVVNKELTPLEDCWLQIYDAFSDSEKQELAELIQLSSNRRDAISWLSYLRQLSKPERELCTAFIRGVLAEKNLKEG